jgi:hypothetical protein
MQIFAPHSQLRHTAQLRECFFFAFPFVLSGNDAIWRVDLNIFANMITFGVGQIAAAKVHSLKALVEFPFAPGLTFLQYSRGVFMDVYIINDKSSRQRLATLEKQKNIKREVFRSRVSQSVSQSLLFVMQSGELFAFASR